MPGAVPVPQCMAGRCCWEHQGCGVPWASGTKGQDLSMAGVRVETALEEVPRGRGFVSMKWVLCHPPFLKA